MCDRCRWMCHVGFMVACVAMFVLQHTFHEEQLRGEEVVNGAVGAVKFTDVSSAIGLQLAASAACWADVDNDGWSDLAAGGVVWKNEMGEKFSKLFEGIGEVVASDFDNDGWCDYFSYSQLKLYRNIQGGRFEAYPLPELPKTVSLGACWGDWDRNGRLDLFVGGYEEWDAGITYPSFVLKQREGGVFEVGMQDTRYRARGVSACDYDRDGDLDIYVSNYRLQPNVLWVNDGNGNFSDLAMMAGAVGTSEGFAGGHSIGACWGDFDTDGRIDLFVGNFAHVDRRGDQPKSRFLRNLGEGTPVRLEDKGTCGVFYQESYASPAAGDADNDGDLDLFFTTVYESASFGVRNEPTFFVQRSEWDFVNGNQVAGVAGLGATYQASWADYDLDGDLDLVTAGKLFRNESPELGHWLSVRLEGDGTEVACSAVGAQVRVFAGERTLVRQVEAGTGQGNQNDFALHFGLGDHTGAVRIEVDWPDGVREVVLDCGIDQCHKVKRIDRVNRKDQVERKEGP